VVDDVPPAPPPLPTVPLPGPPAPAPPLVGAPAPSAARHTQNNKGRRHTTSPVRCTSVCRQWLRHITTKSWTKQQGGRNTAQSHHNEKCKQRSREAVALELVETPRTTARGRGGRRGGGCCRGGGAGRDGGRRGVRWEHGREQLHKGQWGVRDTTCKGKDLVDTGTSRRGGGGEAHILGCPMQGCRTAHAGAVNMRSAQG